MRILIGIFLVVFGVAAPNLAISAGLSPWQFGMTKEQVRSFKQFGPYKSFSNGDLETFNGIFHGHKENIQFFFKNNRLVRIGIYLWEGKDPKRAIAPFQRAYELLQKDYGKVVIPEMKAAANSEPIPPEVAAIGAAAHADIVGETRIVPVSQPNDARVFASVKGGYARDGKWFVVAIFLDSY